ncbi:hypothetical protein [Rickettsiella endosymbiont of Dermanyssus gallinae]|uniref:hypothetical protein n=1 Tax=Rickettsiella endosymbiont of Dermanyssus gallinae TaxID=2856608 RepID=UPI001C52F9C5|nr:hypothetical protein [Rickettsiella endosymbiont of Dermanyssus gallinae]
MFNLANVITSFNQTYRKKLKLNKTWGLFHLQPEVLALFNKSAQLIRDSADYRPAFTTNCKRQYKTSAKTRSRPGSKEISSFRDSAQKITINQAISYRLSWESRLLTTLSNEEIWLAVEEKINQKNESVRYYFSQVRQNWNIYRPYQYHSSEGLLCLLSIVINSQQFFLQADKELQRKQQTWIPFLRLPAFIAEAYESFLKKELEKRELLRKEALAALLLRLKTVEQQGQVTCDDASYTLALQSEWLGLINFKLPEYKTSLDANTFNRMQRAIEKYGDASHKSQLYELAWYQAKKSFDAEELTTITISGSRFLTPNALLALMSKDNRKWFWFSWGNKLKLQFLEEQQAVLAQLLLQPVHDTILLKPICKGYPELLTLSTQYQLLQQSRCSLKKQYLYWWQWEKKIWKKAWQKWLGQQLEKKQVSLLHQLDETFEEVKKYNFKLQNVKFRAQVQVILKTIQALRVEGISKYDNASLINMFKYVDENSRAKRDDTAEQAVGSTKASPQTRQNTSKENAQAVSVTSLTGSQQNLHTTENGFNSQPGNSSKDGCGKKMTGFWQTKTLAGNNQPISTEKKPTMHKPTSLLARVSAFDETGKHCESNAKSKSPR